MSKGIEWVVAKQHQIYLEEENCLDPFQSRFGLRHNIETAVVTQHSDLFREA